MFQRVLVWAGQLLRSLLGLILPLASRENVSRLGRAARAIVTVVLVIAIVAGLWYINSHTRLRTFLPDLTGRLADWWMPLIFLLVVALCWGSWWLWKLMVAEDLQSYWPDIDLAWDEAVATLRRAGIDLKDYPVFLILGKPAGDDDTLFAAANLANNLSLAVRGAPGPEAPVRVYACKEPKQEAIYVICPGASVLSAYASRLSRQAGASGGTPARLPEDEMSEEEITRSLTPDNPTMRPGQRKDARAFEDMLHQIEREGRNLEDPVVQREFRRLDRLGNTGTPHGLDATTTENQRARLGHLCRLIVRDRYPYCGVNGALVLVPFAGTDSTQDAADTGFACHHDLDMARAALGVHCPVFAVVCDMESAPGFTEFVEQFSTRERLRRMGQRCHLFPSLPSGIEDRSRAGVASVRSVYKSLAAWISKGFLRRWIYEKCRLEKAETEGHSELLTDNARLFYLLCEMQERQDQLAKVLEVGFSNYANPGWLLFGGCYLAATGGGSCKEHRAFMAGVFDRLIEGQSFVYWTEQVRAEERRLQRFINFGWAALVAAGLLGVAALVYAAFFARGGG
jgi:hypothetical protein